MRIFKNVSDEHFKILRSIIIFWTVFSLIMSLLTILSIETMVEVFFNQYNLNNTLQLNTAYKAANKPMHEKELKEPIKEAFKSVTIGSSVLRGKKSDFRELSEKIFLSINFFTVIFNGIGLASVKKKNYCLSVKYFVYLTFTAFMMYINCLTSKYNIIPAFLNSLMACVVLCFLRGLNERRWEVLGVMTDGIQNNPINWSMNGFNGQLVTYPIHMISRPEPYVTSNCVPQNIGNTKSLQFKYEL